MRLLWRISNRCDLQGMGGEKTDGRWHTAKRGKRVVYLSDYPALALIEVLANLKGNPKLFPDCYQLMKITVADQVATSALELHCLFKQLARRYQPNENHRRFLAGSREFCLVGSSFCSFARISKLPV
jgi:RES domain-containing protein